MLPLRLGRGWQRFNSTRLRHDLDQTPSSRLTQRRSLNATQSQYSRSGHNHHRTPTSPWLFYPTCAVILGAACLVTYQTSQPFRHSALATLRCSRVAGEHILVGGHLHCANSVIIGAAIASAVDYKITMAKDYESTNEEKDAYSGCHTRSAQRVLKALLANGGVSCSRSDLKALTSFCMLKAFSLNWVNTCRRW